MEPSRLPVKPSAPETVERGAHQPGCCRQELEVLDEEAEVGRCHNAGDTRHEGRMYGRASKSAFSSTKHVIENHELSNHENHQHVIENH